ncbi:Hypothetical protein, putative [Bodo saltans]|uniref:Uncharacterized protein n=1 Tax=Bodo saltans TaxID=75058 RepID=A0A0S4JYD7_BODSA|nr:Hypothetical protein, putative [Bodo saltans]|eukprot:CUG93608.1 Hypothetical protein, putative [Bodo saltans]
MGGFFWGRFFRCFCGHFFCGHFWGRFAHHRQQVLHQLLCPEVTRVVETPTASNLPQQTAQPEYADSWFGHLEAGSVAGSIARLESAAKTVADGVRAMREESSHPQVTQLEDKVSADIRQLRTAMESCIGTEERPFLGGALYAAVTGRTTSQALLEVIRVVRDKTPEHDNIIQMFVAAGKETTPGYMVGEDELHQAARWGSRVVLRDLAEAFMCEVLVLLKAFIRF